MKLSEVSGKRDGSLKKNSEVVASVHSFILKMVLLFIKVRAQKESRLKNGREGRLTSVLDLPSLRCSVTSMKRGKKGI